MRIEEAIEAFGRGFAFTRSYTHPYLFERCGPLWVMRDGPRHQSECRREEWLVAGSEPEAAEVIIQANRRGRYAVCAAIPPCSSPDDLKCKFKALGYRNLGSEMFFAHSLNDIAQAVAQFPIVRVTTPEEADLVKRASGVTQIRRSDLEVCPPVVRQYMALDGAQPVGWVRSIACGESGWCSNMFVKPTYRRRGIGAALMSRMLQDDKTAGLRSAVLLASRAGALLYPRVGYTPVGQLLIFQKPTEQSAQARLKA